MAGTMSIALVDDDRLFLDEIQSYLDRVAREEGLACSVSLFQNGADFVSGYTAKYDVIFLDIEMPGINGLETARRIRALDQTVHIIFVTNMAQYAIRGYEVDATDFIVKPVNYLAFAQKLKRVGERLRRREERYLTVPVANGMARVGLSQITYIESMRHQVIVHARDRDYAFASTLKELEGTLSSDHFFRCNHCYLVNLAHVESVRESVATVGGAPLQISRPKRRAFLDALADYLGGVGRG